MILLTHILLVIAVSPAPLTVNNELKEVVKSAFEETHDGFSSDEVILNDELFEAFVSRCQLKLPETDAVEFGWTLINLRKAGKLADITATRRNNADLQPVLHIAEIVCRTMTDQHQLSIDRMMVDPELREEFNTKASEIVADVDLYRVRKAAFRLRKTRKLRPELITRLADWGREIQSFSAQKIASDFELVTTGPGIYIFRDSTGYLYIGESKNLRQRLKQHLDESSSQSLANYLLEHSNEEITIELHTFAPDSRIKEVAVRRAYESELIQSRNPKFNLNAK